MLGVRVVDASGRPAAPMQHLLREQGIGTAVEIVLRPLPPRARVITVAALEAIDLGAAFVRADRRRLRDVIARTAVVRA